MKPVFLEGYDWMAKLQEWRVRDCDEPLPLQNRSWRIWSGPSMVDHIEVHLSWMYQSKRFSLSKAYYSIEESVYFCLLEFESRNWEGWA